MIIPTEEQLLDYFKQYHIPQNIRAHCEKVGDVAVFLAEALQKTGETINPELVNALALVHDMFKHVTFNELTPNEEFHPAPFAPEEIASWKGLKEKYGSSFEGKVAKDIFTKDFPDFAKKIEEESDPIKRKTSWEPLLVHYADWRVSKECIVPLRERLQYILKRYKLKKDYWKKSCALIREDEKKIFLRLPFSPEELKEAFDGR